MGLVATVHGEFNVHNDGLAIKDGCDIVVGHHLLDASIPAFFPYSSRGETHQSTTSD